MKLEDFTRGWIVGDFDPAIVKTKDVEVGIISLKAGEKGDGHKHFFHTEYNLILHGVAKIKDKIFGVGDFFIFLPHQESTVEFLTDTRLLVIKTPSTKGDKHYA